MSGPGKVMARHQAHRAAAKPPPNWRLSLLNGKNLWLRGSNLVFEWNWGETITGHELDYLVKVDC